RGEPAGALPHVEQAAALLYDPRRHHTHSFLFGQDPGIICKAFGAVVLWLLGYADQAERQSEDAVQASWELSPSSQTVALHFAAMLHQLRGEGLRAGVCADASSAVAAEHGFSFWRAGAAVLSGWSRAQEEGLGRFRQGLRDWVATGSLTYQTYYL